MKNYIFLLAALAMAFSSCSMTAQEYMLPIGDSNTYIRYIFTETSVTFAYDEDEYTYPSNIVERRKDYIAYDEVEIDGDTTVYIILNIDGVDYLRTQFKDGRTGEELEITREVIKLNN